VGGEDTEPDHKVFWAKVGGGLELIPDGARFGPADAEPPGGPWEELHVQHRLVGWGLVGHAGRALARQAEEEGARLARERHAYLVRRLGHRLRSSVLALQGSARQAAFGHKDLLQELYDLAQDVGRRAQAIEAVALEPPDTPRAVVLGAALAVAAPAATRKVPAGAVVRASEPVLVEALARTVEWMGGPALNMTGERAGAWWRLEVTAGADRQALPVPELGEPLIRLLVDLRLDGWLDTSKADSAVLYLPALDV
jgi:hypothetical protein